MKNSEALTLCKIAESCCPQQKFDPFTPDAWADLLGDLRFVDAKEALMNIARRQPFVAPAEIRAEVATLRRRRIEEAPALEPPADLDPNDTLAYRRWLRQTQRAIADGDQPPDRKAITGRPMPPIEGTFQEVPNA